MENTNGNNEDFFDDANSIHFARLEQVRLGLFYFFVMLLTLFIIGGFWDEIEWKDLFFILLATVIIVGVIYLGRSCTENLTADGITYQRGESVDQTVIVIQSETGGGAVWDDLPPTYSQCINSKPQSSPPLYCANNNNETTKPTTTQNGDKIIVTSLTSPNSSST